MENDNVKKLINDVEDWLSIVHSEFIKTLNKELKFYYNYSEELSPMTAPRVAYKSLVRAFIDNEFNHALILLDDNLIDYCFRANEKLAVVRTIKKIIARQYPMLFSDDFQVIVWEGEREDGLPEIIYYKKNNDKKCHQGEDAEK